MKKLVIALIVAVVAIPVGLYFGGYLTLASPQAAEGGEGEEEVVTDSHGNVISAGGVPLYLTLDPPFVVNFMHRGTMRYLQLSLDLMFHEQAMLDRVKEHMPAIRNDLILLLSNQEFETLSSPDGKEVLREKIMVAVNEILEIDPATLAEEDAGQVYFTNFVMQ